MSKVPKNGRVEVTKNIEEKKKHPIGSSSIDPTVGFFKSEKCEGK